MNVDTGAKCNVVPQETFKQIKDKKQTMRTKPTNLVANGGSKIETHRMVKLQCQLEKQMYTLPFYIAQEDVLPLLGLRACIHAFMGLVSFSKDVHQLSLTNDDFSHLIQTEYSDLFSNELGKLPVTYSMTLNPEVRPVVCPARCIPVAMKDRVKAELDRMQELRVITPVSETTETGMPFGLNSANEVFQRSMEQIFTGYPCAIIVDDILIEGRTVKEHDVNLRKVFNCER